MQNPIFPKEYYTNLQKQYLTKIDGTEVAPATPTDVADTYLSNADTNRFTTDDQSKLASCLEVEVLTAAAYEALDEPDIETLYVIIG